MKLSLLAQTARRDSLIHAQEYFTRENPVILKQIATVVMVVGVVILLVWVLAKWQSRPRGGCSPMRLYLRMQGRLGLPWSYRWRLWRLARLLKLEHPTAVLISPVLFDEAVARYRQEAGPATGRGSPPPYAAVGDPTLSGASVAYRSTPGPAPGDIQAFAAIRSRLFP
jgi:hypothetical protein